MQKSFDKVFENKNFVTSEKTCMLAFINYSDRKGVVKFSYSELADKVGCSKKTIVGIVKKLVMKNVVTIEKSINTDGGNSTNKYILSDEFIPNF